MTFCCVILCLVSFSRCLFLFLYWKVTELMDALESVTLESEQRCVELELAEV